MTNYITVDTTTLINLAKADPGNKYLDLLLNIPNTTLMLTDVVLGEATDRANLYANAAQIYDWYVQNSGPGKPIQIYTSEVPLGKDAGENSIIDFCNNS
jgi:hypothetical protein